MARQAQYNAEFNRRFANSGHIDGMMKKYYPKRWSQIKGKTTYGKPFRKKTSKGKFRKGTWIRYKYVNGRRVGSVKSKK